MTLETILTYALRLWLAGLLHIGIVLIQVGPFGLAGLGFGGWLLAHADPQPRPAGAVNETPAPAFTLR